MLHARRPPSVYSQDDPLSYASRPPDAETDLERRARLQKEADSKRISDIIDEQLKADKRNYEKSKQDVRVSFFSLFSHIVLMSPTSSSCWVRPNRESPPCKSNFNSCTAPTR
jgi:hypothetical protein